MAIISLQGNSLSQTFNCLSNNLFNQKQCASRQMRPKALISAEVITAKPVLHCMKDMRDKVITAIATNSTINTVQFINYQ